MAFEKKKSLETKNITREGFVRSVLENLRILILNSLKKLSVN